MNNNKNVTPQGMEAKAKQTRGNGRRHNEELEDGWYMIEKIRGRGVNIWEKEEELMWIDKGRIEVETWEMMLQLKGRNKEYRSEGGSIKGWRKRMEGGMGSILEEDTKEKIRKMMKQEEEVKDKEERNKLRKEMTDRMQDKLEEDEVWMAQENVRLDITIYRIGQMEEELWRERENIRRETMLMDETEKEEEERD